MKYGITLLLFFSLTAVYAQASLGVLSGYNRSQMQYDVEVPDDARTHIPSWHVSGWLTVPVGNRFKLNTELGFIQRGAACEPGFINFNQDTELRLQYGQLAINVSYDLLRWKKLTLSSYLGGGGAYLLSGSRSFDDPWNDLTVRTELDMGENGEMNRLDGGAHYGGLIKYRVGCGELLGRVGGYHGFLDIDKDSFSRGRDWVLSLGYAQSF